MGKNYQAVLSFSFCTDEQFTCDDGNCVEMSQRCDGTTDCEDRSDEKECRLTVPNVGTNKFLVPPGKGNPVQC